MPVGPSDEARKAALPDPVIFTQKTGNDPLGRFGFGIFHRHRNHRVSNPAADCQCKRLTNSKNSESSENLLHGSSVIWRNFPPQSWRTPAGCAPVCSTVSAISLRAGPPV